MTKNKRVALMRELNREFPVEYKAIGGYSATSKMPSLSYNLPASACRTGRKLATVPGSVCKGCYARKGSYLYPNVRKSLDRHMVALTRAEWVDSNVTLMSAMVEKKVVWFRWHDSGDIQSLAHLEDIVEIARQVPGMTFWLPTKEYGDIRTYVKRHGAFPANLTVRVSAPMVDSISSQIAGTVSSSVHHNMPAIGFACPATTGTRKTCQDCVACWSGKIANISYGKH